MLVLDSSPNTFHINCRSEITVLSVAFSSNCIFSTKQLFRIRNLLLSLLGNADLWGDYCNFYVKLIFHQHKKHYFYMDSSTISTCNRYLKYSFKF